MLKELKKRIAEEQMAKENMSIEEMRHEQQLVDYKIKEIMNDLGYKRCQQKIDENTEDYIIARYSLLKAITPDLPIEEPNNSLNIGDEHLDTIPATESDKVIKSSVDNLVPIPSEFEDIEYVSLEEVNNDQEEKEFDLEDILQIQDVILREKLLNINRLIVNIKSLNDNPSTDHVFKSPSLVPIPVTDSDSFFEESDTSLSHLDYSLPEFEPFSDDTEETRSGSTTTHANNSLPEYDSFLF
ncbi:hypothetical protein Tco_0563316 [Tanacetum coccineum]